MLKLELSSYLMEIPKIVIKHSLNSDLLLTTQSRVMQADWFILEINEKATLNINIPYSKSEGCIVIIDTFQCF